MRILHYFLGFPPYRSGGLTRYAIDLMTAQKKEGHNIMALWPGQMYLFGEKVIIKKKCDVKGIENYELINPLPIPLDEGIGEIDAYMKKCDWNVYVRFLEEKKPDAIHVHTLMGIHKEFLEAAESLNIKTVFTTHDYFGICPKVTLYNNGDACESDNDCRECVRCNVKALSLKKIKILQSPIYRTFKETAIVSVLRKRHRGDFFEEKFEEQEISCNEEEKARKFRELRNYYISILESMSLIHFNSSVAKQIYEKYINPKASVVMNITHKDIKDHRKVINWEWTGKLRITALIPAKPFKGFNVLQDALDELWKQGKRNFELKIFSPVRKQSEYMVICENGFQKSELVDIFGDTDVLVAPSVWYETFGFTVLEALSYGVPVIVSNRIGAKDILGNAGIIVEANNVEALKNAICKLDKKKIEALRENVQQIPNIKSWNSFVKDNYELYM